MTKLDIRTNFPDIRAKMLKLAPDVANIAMARALNRTVEQGRTEMARDISQEYRLQVGKIKSRLDVRKAYAKGRLQLSASLMASPNKFDDSRSMNMIAFARGKVTRRGARKLGKDSAQGQLAFQVKRSGGIKTITGAFIGNNGRTVFIRTGKGRTPIKAVTTIGVPQMFNARRINQAVVAVMRERLSANFSREVRVVLQGFAR